MSVCEGDYILTSSKWDELVWIWERTRAPKGCGTAVPARLGLYVPDLVVVPEAAAKGHDSFVPAAAAELAVEITSKATAHRDRTTKAAGYAAAGVRLYLLVDSWAPGGPTVTLYGEPEEGVYRLLRAGKFGESILLPAPFDLELDTSEFPGT